MTRDASARCPFEDDVLVLRDGVLDPTRRLVVEAHLGICESCAALDESLDGAESAVRAATTPPLGAVEAGLRRLPPPFASRPGVRAAAGLLLAAGIAAGAVALLRTPPEPRAPDIPRAPATDTPQQRAADRTEQEPARPSPDAQTAPPEERADATPSPEGPPVSWTLPSLAGLREQVAALGGDDDEALDAAVRRVRAAGPSGAAALAAILDDANVDVAARALRVAASIRSLQLLPALARSLEDPRLGSECARQLAAYGSATALDHLVRALDGPARRAALDALVEARSDAAFARLADRARSGADDVDDGSFREILDAAVDVSPSGAARLLLDLDPIPWPVCTPIRPEVVRRSEAIRDVLRERAAELRPALLAAMRGNDLADSVRAIRAIADAPGARDASVVAPIRAAAANRPGLMREAAAALVRIGGADAWSAAFEIATDPRAPAEIEYAFAKCEDAVPVLGAHIEDARPARRVAAVRALGWTGSPAAVPLLARALADPSARGEAIVALGRVGGDAAAAALAAETRPRGDEEALAHALGHTGSAVAVPALRRLARDSAHAAAAAQALGGIPDRESVLALADLLAEPRAARAAAAALGEMPVRVVVPALLSRLDDPVAAARARRALAVVAGSDLGRSPDAWRTWWRDVGSAPSAPESSDSPDTPEESR